MNLLEAIEGLRTYGEEHCDSETYFGAAVFSDTENEQITPTVSLDDPTPFHGSNDLQHRWALHRTCSNTDGKRLLVIGMNPSSASTLDETTHGGAPTAGKIFNLFGERCSEVLLLNLYPIVNGNSLEPNGDKNLKTPRGQNQSTFNLAAALIAEILIGNHQEKPFDAALLSWGEVSLGRKMFSNH